MFFTNSVWLTFYLLLKGFRSFPENSVTEDILKVVFQSLRACVADGDKNFSTMAIQIWIIITFEKYCWVYINI